MEANRGSQRDVVYLWLTISTPRMRPHAGGGIRVLSTLARSRHMLKNKFIEHPITKVNKKGSIIK
jgi:hypothetical protein